MTTNCCRQRMFKAQRNQQRSEDPASTEVCDDFSQALAVEPAANVNCCKGGIRTFNPAVHALRRVSGNERKNGNKHQTSLAQSAPRLATKIRDASACGIGACELRLQAYIANTLRGHAKVTAMADDARRTWETTCSSRACCGLPASQRVLSIQGACLAVPGRCATNSPRGDGEHWT